VRGCRVGAAIALLVAATLAGCSQREGDLLPTPDATLVSADDRYPNQSARDWVTYADHAIVVTVVAERALPLPPQIEDAGEGIVDREVSLRVDRVLWSSRSARQLPAVLTWPALGWAYRDRMRGARLAVRETPRLELNGAYILAVRWEPPRCPEGDARIPGRWVGLGAGAILPFNDGVVGNGESQGEPVLAIESTPDAQPGDPTYTFEDSLTGRGARDVRSELTNAIADPTPDFEDKPLPCE
jgi:hypothetical protein